MTTIYPKPFKKDNTWYFRYTDASGFRRKKSTKTGNKTKAQQFIRSFIDIMNSGANTEAILLDVITPYQDVKTNPKYNDAMVSGANYSLRYAKKIAREATALIAALSPGLLRKPAYQITRREVKDVAQHVIAKYGQTAKARSVYKLLKLILSQAADDGIIQVSPAQGLPDIKAVRVKKTHALPADDISLVITRENLFPSPFARDLFIVLASTGLRRSELLALIPSQIQGNTLTVNRAYKDDSCKVIGMPKWDKVRILYLPHIAKSALQRLFSERASLGIGPKELARLVRMVGEHASNVETKMPDVWETLTPHVMRHSLNTMLLVSGLSPLLVAEYMSWEHQVHATQSGYTHFYAENLKPVANMIDKLLGVEKVFSNQA